jgi:N-acetylglucosamine-6-phosphate deacetylase
VTGVTHLFNAMSQLTAREPGVVGAALDDERLFAGIICDGHHVDPSILRVAIRCKGPDRLMLITDAMPLVGTDLQHFLLQGRRITLQGARLTGPDGTLAGAHLTMMQAAIAPGYRADLVAFSSKFEVIETWVAGQPNTSPLLR